LAHHVPDTLFAAGGWGGSGTSLTCSDKLMSPDGWASNKKKVYRHQPKIQIDLMR